MVKEKGSQGTGLSDKIRSSMVIKLSLRMIRTLFAAFFLLNVLISVLFFGLVLWNAELKVQTILEEGKLNTEEEIPALRNFEVTMARDMKSGYYIPAFVKEVLPLASWEVERRFAIPDNGISLGRRLDGAEYIIQAKQDNQVYSIVYALKEDMYHYYFFILVVLGFELLYMLGRIRKNTRAIRKTLRPLSEMAATARSLHENVASSSPNLPGAHIKHMAGAINSIDVQKLNQPISIDSSQDELKDLAYAINDMLRRLGQSYESQIRFVSDASHELRTPISVIQGYVGLLDRWGKDDAQTLEESIQAIKGETESMKVLVEQLLFLARGDNETIQFHEEIFDICSILEDILKETSLYDSTHVYETQLNGPAYIEGDQQLIKQAVRILVDNSIKFTPAGETIMLKVFKDKEEVHIQVQDNGLGIEAEDVPRIFHRFYRSDESRARKTGGSGLGLSIAKWIVERHKGYFEVVSRLDIGTRITIILPAAKGGLEKNH